MIAHAGLEDEDIPLPEWRERYRELIDVGCDVIIGGHTHMVQGCEIFKEKLICYSLGNFVFERNLAKKILGVLVNLCHFHYLVKELNIIYSELVF